jgi:hypothetical protein
LVIQKALSAVRPACAAGGGSYASDMPPIDSIQRLPGNARRRLSSPTAAAVPMALPVSLRIEPSVLALEPGARVRVQAFAQTRGGQSRDVTRASLWSTDDDSVAAIDDEGNLTAIASGVTTLSVECADVASEIVVTVA